MAGAPTHYQSTFLALEPNMIGTRQHRGSFWTDTSRVRFFWRFVLDDEPLTLLSVGGWSERQLTFAEAEQTAKEIEATGHAVSHLYYSHNGGSFWTEYQRVEHVC
jgi:hypothetical protein